MHEESCQTDCATSHLRAKHLTSLRYVMMAYMSRPMDLVPACEAFIAVTDQGGFTLGAASLRVSQPVVSRRVSTLERALGGRLLQRSARSVTLTRFGRTMLPAVRRVVAATDTLREQAELRRKAPVRLVLPQELGLAELGRFCAAAGGLGDDLEVLQATPLQRTQMLAEDQADLALVPAPPDVARWRSSLGVAARPTSQQDTMRLASLRPRRGSHRTRLLWLLPEDDVPHVRDPLERFRDRHGLELGQVRRAPSSVQAVRRVLSEDDLLLTTQSDASRLGLGWRRIVDLQLDRCHLMSSSETGRYITPRPGLEDLIGQLLDPAGRTPSAREQEFDHAG